MMAGFMTSNTPKSWPSERCLEVSAPFRKYVLRDEPFVFFNTKNDLDHCPRASVSYVAASVKLDSSAWREVNLGSSYLPPLLTSSLCKVGTYPTT